jgi:hypothetical protein
VYFLKCRTLVDIEPNDPLVVVNCGRILISLPNMDVINYGMQLLLKGLQMAPNDLTVFKAIIRVIIINKKKVIYISLLFMVMIRVFIINIVFYLDQL